MNANIQFLIKISMNANIQFLSKLFKNAISHLHEDEHDHKGHERSHKAC